MMPPMEADPVTTITATVVFGGGRGGYFGAGASVVVALGEGLCIEGVLAESPRCSSAKDN